MTSRRFLVAALVATLGVLSAGTGTALAAGGTVTGTVVDAATKKPVAGICVNVVEAPINNSVGTSAATKSNGVWTLSGVPAGATYTAYATRCKGSADYVGQWYLEQEFQMNATDFAVTNGATTSGINFSLSLGGAVTGKVTDAVTKKPVKGILVVAYSTTAFQPATYGACTSEKGTYKLTGAPTSGVYVEFVGNACTPSTYKTVWYKNAPSYGTATVVPIAANKTTSGINQVVSE